MPRSLAAITSLLFILGVAGAAHAAPYPTVRRLRGAALPALGSRAADAARAERGPTAGCGTAFEAVGDVLAQHFARPLSAPAPTPNSLDAGEIAVLENDGNFFYNDKDGYTKADLASISRAFYRTHGDDYDFLAVYFASGVDIRLGIPTALASAYPVRNFIHGIGLESFDVGESFGSPNRLQMIVNMNGLHRYPNDPDENIGTDSFSTMDVLAHELGHRWLAYVYVDSAGTPTPALLGRALIHWNFFFDTDASLMEGCEWAIPAADSFVTDSVSGAFGPLDQYLMGLRDKSEVESLLVINDPSDFNPPGDYVPYTSPFVGLGCHGRETRWTIDAIEAVHGPRIPNAAVAPKNYRVGVILAIPRGASAGEADLAKLEGIRSRLGPYYFAATEGRGSFDLELDSRAGQVRIAHESLGDTEEPLSPRPIGAKVTILQAGIPLAVDPASVRAFWRPLGDPAFTEVPLTPAGTDSFAGELPALGSEGQAEYYLYASSDSSGIESFDPPGGAAAPHRYRAGADLTPPAIVHHAVPYQGAHRMPQKLIARASDNLGLDSVWVEYYLDDGRFFTVAPSTAGKDSFAVSLGLGLGPNRWLAYRFVARDRSAAHNTTHSNAAYDTLRVTYDWTNDFENGSDGYSTANGTYSYRDLWHLTQELSSPAGRTGWKCGEEGAAYPPHMDAALYTPFIFGGVPGTKVTFDHRYDLENKDASQAWDGARIEVQSAGGPWMVVTPTGGYSHVVESSANPLGAGTPCWSGKSNGWRSEEVDITPYLPGPVRLRFRMGTDEFIGADGWYVDHVIVDFPQPPLDVPSPWEDIAVAPPWPNPTRGSLRLALSLPERSTVEWALFDLAGRRAATLWKGSAAAGPFDLAAELPASLASGLYFSRLSFGARQLAANRVVVVR